MILALTGFRRYSDERYIHSYLDTWKSLYTCSSARSFLHVRVGDAPGADSFVVRWCQRNRVSHNVFYADWDNDGKSAGPHRNERMLLGQGDHVAGPTWLLVAFPRTDGVKISVPGSGTWGCVIRAFELGIKVEIPQYERPDKQ